MSCGRKILCTTIISLVLLIAISLALITVARHYLPTYLTGILTEKMSELLESPVHVQVRRAWLYGSDLEDIRIGPAENPVLIIRSVQVDYSPWALYRLGRIDDVRVVGAELFTELSGGRLRLKNANVKGWLVSRKNHKNGRRQEDSFQLPISIGSLMINGVVWVTGYGDGQERIPFAVVLDDVEKSLHKACLEAIFYPRGQKISIKARTVGGQLAVDIGTHDLALGVFSDLLFAPDKRQFSGRMSLQASLDIGIAPLAVTSLMARCSIADARVESGRFQLRTISSEHPFLIGITAKKSEPWKIVGSGLSVAGPLPVALDEFSLELEPAPDGVRGRGNVRAIFYPQSREKRVEPAGIKAEPVALPIEISGEYSGDGAWRVEIATQRGKEVLQELVALQYSGVVFKSKLPSVACTVKGTGSGGSFDFKLEIPGPQLYLNGLNATIASTLLESKADFSFHDKASVRGNAELVLVQAYLQSGAANVTLSETRLQGRYKLDGAGAILADGRVVISDGRVEIPTQKLYASGISVMFPFRWPTLEKIHPGLFSTGPIVFRTRDLGTMQGSLGQTGSGLTFSGNLSSQLVPQLSISLAGIFDFIRTEQPALHLQFDLARPRNAAEVDISSLIPGVSGLLVGGGLSVKGGIDREANSITGHLTASWENGWLRIPEEKITIEGIHASLQFPDLPLLRSAPRQMVSFSKAAAGDLLVENGEIEFQLESFESLFIEKSRFEWCQGIVEVPAFRIVPGTDDYLLTLYCDRLNLAELLDQLGIDAEGKGALSGRIPLHYTGDHISFKEGFLFSTPGEGGKIRITQSDILTAGVLPQSPEYAQMALASEALRDYDYSWAKLNLNTEGEDLLIRLQLDGKPAGVLPFVYRKEKGSFVRSETGNPGSHFQGIRLNVNFRLPLNRLLRYNNIVPMMN